jgi:transcriptional regulator with XRE-family HTH domain
MKIINETKKKQRGERIRDIRNRLYMSRKAFSDKHKIPYPTLQNWEDGRFGGLSKRGARRLATIFTEEGIYCTEQWLLEGQGPEPKEMPRIILPVNEPEISVYDAVQKELKLFYQHNPEAIYAIVPDDLMEPRFCKGEFVAGNKHDPEKLERLINRDCIIQLKTGEVYIRRPMRVVDDKVETLALRNEQTKQFRHKDIMYIAPVIWARRED